MKMKTKKYLIIASVILILFSSTLILINLGNTEKNEYEAYFIVSDRGGVGIMPGIIFFGKMRPGDRGSATIHLNNTINKRILMEITSSEELTPYFLEQEIILRPYENRTLDLTVVIPKNSTLGEYRGKVIIITKKLLL